MGEGPVYAVEAIDAVQGTCGVRLGLLHNCTIGNIRIDDPPLTRSVPSLKNTLTNWSLGAREALSCLMLGVRDTRHAGLWWRSALWCTVVVAVWLALYLHFGRFFLELSAILAMLSVTGLMGLGVMQGVAPIATGPATVSQMSNVAGSLGSLGQALLSIAQIALVLLALATFFYLLVFIVASIGTARLPLRWLFLARAKEVVARRYALWQAPAGLERTRPRWLWRMLLVLSLLIPIWALCVLVVWLLACNVWLIYGAAAEGVLDKEQQRALRHQQRPAIVFLGLLLCLLMLVPVLNLLLPAVLCTSVCHLQRRSWRKAVLVKEST